MADIAWRGDAQEVEQVTTIAVTGTWGTGDTATLTINGKDITVTVGTATAIGDVVAALVAAVNGTALVGDESRNETGDQIPEWSGITASGASSPLTLTGDTTVPFTVTVSESTASTGALGTPSNSTTSSSKNHLNADNVTGGTLPGAGDTFTLENSTVSMQYGLDQSSAGTLSAVYVRGGFTGQVGLPRHNSAGYAEYRDRYYAVRTSVLEIGGGGGAGSGRLLIDLGSVQSAITVYGTGSSVESDYHALRIKGTHASNTMVVTGGTVDVAPEKGETATIATLSVAGTGTVRTHRGVTLTTVTAGGSSILTITSATGLSDITTLTVSDAATVYVYGDNAITTLNVLSGICYFQSSGTVTNVNLGSNGTLTLANATAGVTFTNTTAEPGSILLDEQKRVTFTNAVDIGDASWDEFSGWRLGKGRNVLPS